MEIKEIEARLLDIWETCLLEPNIKERGFVFADPIKADLLITGINPSWRGSTNDVKANCHGPAKENFKPEVWKERSGKTWDTYFGPLRQMLIDEALHINLLGRFDYLDIFHFKEQKQRFLVENIIKKQPDGIDFLRKELNLTQHIIEENIQPKLIVVKNKESWAYWGKIENYVWMGYQFKHVCNYPCGELCKIIGFRNSTERIAPEIKETSLIGTYVLFSVHINQYTKREQRPTAKLLNSVLEQID